MSLDAGHKVPDEDLRVEKVAGVGNPVDVKLVLAGVGAHAHHLHDVQAGHALLPCEHDLAGLGEADQAGVLHHHHHLHQLPLLADAGG